MLSGPRLVKIDVQEMLVPEAAAGPHAQVVVLHAQEAVALLLDARIGALAMRPGAAGDRHGDVGRREL